MEGKNPESMYKISVSAEIEDKPNQKINQALMIDSAFSTTRGNKKSNAVCSPINQSNRDKKPNSPQNER